MICPVCDAELYDLEAESCSECQTALAGWKVCDQEFHARPLLRCCRCGECPSPRDRACRQCHSRFLKRVPTWLDNQFPGWFYHDEDDTASTHYCISCNMEVLTGSMQCGICGFGFHKSTQDTTANAGEAEKVTLAVIPQVEEDLAVARETMSDLEVDDGEAVAPVVPYTHEELGAIIVSRAKAIFDINLCPTLAFGLARISQGTAGNAINLLKTVVRMAQAENTTKLTGAEITNTLVSISLKRMGRDPWVGLDRSQRKYLVALAGAGGRGLSAASLATMSNEKVSTIETMVEPFLLQRSGLPCFSDADRQYHRIGGAFVTRSRSGRCPTILTFKYLEMVQALQDDDPDWFAGENLSSNDAHTHAPDLSKDDLEHIPNIEEVLVPVAVTPPKHATTPMPAMAQPTVGSARNPARRAHKGDGMTAVIAARIIPPRVRLLAERQAIYKALLASGIIRPVPSIKWLSGQSVICAHGHRSHFGLFAHRPEYGTLDSLPDFTPVNWKDRLAAALQARGGTAKDDINDRDPDHDVCWSLGCPICGTAEYTFATPALRDYVMCIASADYWWVFCHLYRRDLGTCGNCELRKIYWEALRSLG